MKEQLEAFVEKMPDFFKPWGEEILLRYFDFGERTSKETYWHVILINIIISVIFIALCKIPAIGIIFKIVRAIYSVAVIVPSLAITVRRLNDIGKDWRYIFMGFIPFAGPIIMLIYMLQPSTDSVA